jgi:hypothetical protein
MLFIKDLQQEYARPNLSESELDHLDTKLIRACLQQEHEQILHTKARLTQLRQSKKTFWFSFLPAPRPIVWRLATVSVLMLGVFGWFHTQSVTQPEYLVLTDRYLAELAPHAAQKKGPNTEVEAAQKKSPNTEVEAKNAYQRNKFNQAAQLFKTLIDSKQADETCYFYGAMAHLFQQKPDYQTVINYLLHLKNQGGGYEMDKTLWYLSLAYIESGQLVDAQNTLQILITRGNYNPERAQQLLKSLN